MSILCFKQLRRANQKNIHIRCPVCHYLGSKCMVCGSVNPIKALYTGRPHLLPFSCQECNRLSSQCLCSSWYCFLTYKKSPKSAVINTQPVSKSPSREEITTLKILTLTLQPSLHMQSLTSSNLYAQQENHRYKCRASEISMASSSTLQSLPNSTQHTKPDENHQHKHIYIRAQNLLPEELNWTPVKNALIAGLKGTSIEWDDIIKRVLERSPIACHLQYQNKGPWDSKTKNKLARLYTQ